MSNKTEKLFSKGSKVVICDSFLPDYNIEYTVKKINKGWVVLDSREKKVRVSQIKKTEQEEKKNFKSIEEKILKIKPFLIALEKQKQESEPDLSNLTGEQFYDWLEKESERIRKEGQKEKEPKEPEEPEPELSNQTGEQFYDWLEKQAEFMKEGFRKSDLESLSVDQNDIQKEKEPKEPKEEYKGSYIFYNSKRRIKLSLDHYTDNEIDTLLDKLLEKYKVEKLITFYCPLRNITPNNNGNYEIGSDSNPEYRNRYNCNCHGWVCDGCLEDELEEQQKAIENPINKRWLLESILNKQDVVFLSVSGGNNITRDFVCNLLDL